MQRMMYRAMLKRGTEEAALEVMRGELKARQYVENHKMMTISGYRWQQNIFLYYECIEEEIIPEEIFSSMEIYLEDWPGETDMRKWIPMIDVFHFNAPASEEHWRRKAPVEKRVGRVAHLKPEMMASYIYYHYQLQEERAFLGGKYEIIAMHENLLFGYQEFPGIVEEPVLEKKLQTSGTPKNWEDSRMDLHFQPWEDGHLYFKHIEQIFAYFE